MTALRKVLKDVKAKGEKALLFSQWTTSLTVVQAVLEEEGIGYTR